jgi:hypothetical protein
MRRPRGPGGRFLTGDEIRALEQQQEQEQAQQPQQPSSRPQSANGTNGNPGSDPVASATEGTGS